jgi:hypothetical protein
MKEFPDDENGLALRNMTESGDDLTKARDIDFSVVFPTISAASKFCVAVAEEGWRCEVSDEVLASAECDVTVTRYMLPTYDAITEMEFRLAQLAAPFEGENDGWGCFSIPNK